MCECPRLNGLPAASAGAARRLAWLAAVSLAVLSSAGTPAAAEDCRLALVLALDVSASVDAREHRLQREGLASALLDADVMRLFLADRPVAVHVFEWAGPATQVALTDWILVERERDLAGLAAALRMQPRVGGEERLTTAVGSALAHALASLAAAPRCAARTIDVSGDGRNNAGPEPQAVYRALPFANVTVNALIVSGATVGDVDPDGDKGLGAWFRSNVLHGSGAFAIDVDRYDDFRRAMREKLLRELRAPEVGGWPTAGDAG